MEQWLEWMRGPVFRACFLLMLLGIARVILISLVNVASMVRVSKVNHREVPWREVFKATLSWAIPIKSGFQQKRLFSFLSMVFHVTIIVTPIFLGAHLMLWERGIGLTFPAIGNQLADYLTLIAIGTGVAIFVSRVVSKESRALSRVQDYLLPLLITATFVMGYLAMHPGINPFNYTSTMFWHVLGGNIVLLTIPFTKISHVGLFPLSQTISELGWHLTPGAGEKVALALGKEDQPI